MLLIDETHYASVMEMFHEKSSLELRQDEKEGEKGEEINDPPASAGNS